RPRPQAQPRLRLRPILHLFRSASFEETCVDHPPPRLPRRRPGRRTEIHRRHRSHPDRQRRAAPERRRRVHRQPGPGRPRDLVARSRGRRPGPRRGPELRGRQRLHRPRGPGRHPAEHVAATLEVSAHDVLVCSTGLIGERLPMQTLLAGITTGATRLAAGAEPDAAAARAIMTTDTVPKTAERTTDSGVRVGGIAKGAGMLAPQLATMLVVLTTDADIDADTADAVLREATAATFDRVDSDACMSTNDTVILMASGASGVAPDIR